MKQRIRELDELKYSEPMLALVQARELSLVADAHEDRALLLGVRASCHRYLADIPAGKGCIELGLKYSGRNHSIRGDLYQRLSMLLCDEGDYETALGINGAAFLEHAGDQGRVGQCLVDRGIMLHDTGGLEGAISCFRRSLPLLESEHRRHRFAALHNLACCLESVGRHTEARKFAYDAAGIEHAAEDDVLRGALAWQLARLEPEAPAAVLQFQKSLSIFVDLAFSGSKPTYAAGQAALVGTELIRAQLAARDIEGAHLTAKSLIKISGPLSSNDIVCRALMDLVAAQDLTKVIQEASRAIEVGLSVKTSRSA